MKSKKGCVRFVSMHDCKAVRRIRIDLEHGVLDDVGRRSGRGIDRDNLAIIAMDDQLATWVRRVVTLEN